MRGWTRRWMMRPDGAGTLGSEVVDTRDRPCGDLLQRFLASRGYLDEESRKAFLNPTRDSLSRSSTLPGAAEAAVRLVEAVRGNKSIAIYGDYDVDGIMASAILYHALRFVDQECVPRIYIPHRVQEGYGLNEGALEKLAKEGVDLVITVDCGVTAIDLAQRAKELGLELIITDHHSFAVDASGKPQLPKPDVLVHPARPDEPAPFTGLCGGGVAFTVARAFLKLWGAALPEDLTEDSSKDERVRFKEQLQGLLGRLMSFAALATIADVVPLVDENRVITLHGLRSLRHTSNKGLVALLRACGLDDPNKRLLASDIAFRVAPVLNAAGRLESAEDAVTLVTTESDDEAKKIAEKLVKLNKKRQRLCRKVTEQAAKMAKEQGFLEPDCRVIVLADKDWNPGLVGICCSRLAERFGRPVILLQQSGATSRGSARSIPGYSVHEALCACAAEMNHSEELLVFGGHAAAAGLTVATHALDQLIETLRAHASEAIQEEDLLESVEVDGVAEVSELTLQTVLDIETKLNPFGAGNPPPRLVLRGVEVTSAVRMGGDGTHLRAQVSSGGRALKAIWWDGAKMLERFDESERQRQLLDLLVEPEIDRWAGRESVLLRVLDVRNAEASAPSASRDLAQSTS